jgi:tetrathionate reductase subunit A
MTVNMLLGNFDHKGGMIAPSTYDTKGKGKGGCSTSPRPTRGKPVAFGISSIRHGIDYEKTTLFEGYPARRNWYPLASDIYEEIIPSIGDAYPYPVKALILYMGAPTYALPPGTPTSRSSRRRQAAAVHRQRHPGRLDLDVCRLHLPRPLLPRTLGVPGQPPEHPNKVQPVRQPVIAPIPEDCTVFGQTYADQLRDHDARSRRTARAARLRSRRLRRRASTFATPTTSTCGRSPTSPSARSPTARTPCPTPTTARWSLFLAAAAPAPSVFDAARWEAIVGADVWRKVVYVLNRGGRFEDHADAYDGDRVAHPYGKLLNLYQEKTARPSTPAPVSTTPASRPTCRCATTSVSSPTPTATATTWQLITHRVISQTKSRTGRGPVAVRADARQRHPHQPADSRVWGSGTVRRRVVSATNPRGEWDLGAGNVKPMVGKVVVHPGDPTGCGELRARVRPLGDRCQRCDHRRDHRQGGSERRRKGVHANAAMWTDPTVTNTCMFDPIGGSVSFYDTHVRLEPA